jgi:hypothetical protein
MILATYPNHTSVLLAAEREYATNGQQAVEKPPRRNVFGHSGEIAIHYFNSSCAERIHGGFAAAGRRKADLGEVPLLTELSRSEQ